MSLDLPAPAADIDEHEKLRLHVLGVRERAESAVPWSPDTVGLPAPAGDDALARATDVAFYASARAEVAGLTEVCLGLLALHRPRDGGGISSDPLHRPRRCVSCMAHWPCPTVQQLQLLLQETYR